MAQYNSYHWYESLFMWITLEFLQLIHGTIYIYIHIHINVYIFIIKTIGIFLEYQPYDIYKDFTNQVPK